MTPKEAILEWEYACDRVREMQSERHTPDELNFAIAIRDEAFQRFVVVSAERESVSSHLNKFFDDVRAERNYQQERWGDEFDRKNTPNDWVAYIVAYTGKAVTLPWDGKAFRAALVKVATLCAAAVEWYDRTGGEMPKRHYDE